MHCRKVQQPQHLQLKTSVTDVEEVTKPAAVPSKSLLAKKKGHLAKMCRNRRDPTTTGKSTTKGMHQVTLDDDGTQDDVYRMYNLLGPLFRLL